MQAIGNNGQIFVNTGNDQTTEKTTNQNVSETLKQQREKIFFTPIELNNTKLDDFNDSQSINLSNPFYNEIKTSDCDELKKIFIAQLNNFIEVDNFYCGDRHLSAINQFIKRIEIEPISNTKYIEPRFRNTSYWFHELTILLRKFKHQQQLPANVTTAISKEAIALRLDSCLVELDKCWDGICSRITHEYEVLASMEQALSGKINLIKKDLFNAIASEYMNKIRSEKREDIAIGDEIHMFSALNNLIYKELGLKYIADFYEKKDLSDSTKEEFIKLVTIEISPAKITSTLASQLYDKLVDALTEISMQEWLTKSKKECELVKNILKLDTDCFEPVNLLFNVTEENTKFNIYSVVDVIIGEDEQTAYSLNRSREKIFRWVANCLMPNTEKVLVADIYDEASRGCISIACIDYMFFWVFNQQSSSHLSDKNYKYDVDNHITLTLAHLKCLDLVEFTAVNRNEHPYLDDSLKKTEVAISLLIQAMEQTHNAKEIVCFFADSDSKVQLIIAKYPLLAEKINNIINNKLFNQSFKQQFITAIKKYYCPEEPPKKKLTTSAVYSQKKLTIIDVYWFVNTQAAESILVEMQKNKINIDGILSSINVTNFSSNGIKVLISIPAIENLLIKAIDDANSEVIYKLLLTGHCNDYINYTQTNQQKGTLLVIALENNHEKLVKLLLGKDNLQLNGNELYYPMYSGNYEIYSTLIEYILGNIDTNKLIQMLQPKAPNNTPGLYFALQNGHDKIVKDHIELILSRDEFTINQKLELIQAKNKNASPGLYIALKRGHDTTTIKEYIQLILASDVFDADKKLELIQANNKTGFPGLFIALQKGHEQTVKEYIELILASDVFNTKQKLELIQAKNKNGCPGLYIALENGYEQAVKEYIELILANNKFTVEQKLELIQAKSKAGYPGLFIALQKGYDKAVKEYIQLILASDVFDADKKLELIQAKTDYDVPGLYMALQKGHSKAVKEYIELILASNVFNADKVLNADKKFELIQAKSQIGFSGLFIALKSGHDKVVKEYIQLVLASKFDTKQKLELIKAKDNDGNPGLYVALQGGHGAAVKEYIKIILNNKEFNLQQKIKICKNAKSYSGYANIVKNSNLNDKEKNKLLCYDICVIL